MCQRMQPLKLRLWLIIGAAVSFTMAFFPAPAAAQVKFEHKFPEGKSSTTVATVKTSQTLTIAGNEVKSGSEQTLTISSVNGRRAADGKLSIKSKLDALKATVKLPGDVELAFDSAKPDAAPPGTQFDFVLDIFKASAKSSWETVVDKDNRISAVNGREEAFATLSEEIRTAMKAQVDPEYLKNAANDELDRLPSKAVSPGDSWERTTTMRLDAGQRFTFTHKYTYEGKIKQDGKELERITSKVLKSEYTVEGDAPLKVVESTLKPVESSGEILFDPAVGEVVAYRNKVQIKGTLKLEVAGMKLDGDLDLTIETSEVVK